MCYSYSRVAIGVVVTVFACAVYCTEAPSLEEGESLELFEIIAVDEANRFGQDLAGKLDCGKPRRGCVGAYAPRSARGYGATASAHDALSPVY